MRGKFLITIGVAAIVAGAFIQFVGYSSANAAFTAIAWAAIIGGALALLAGTGRQVSAFMEQKPNNNSDYGHAEVRTLIKSMGEMAAADGKIDPREVETIASIHQRMLGISISTGEVNKILSDFDAGDDIRKTLNADRKMVNPAMKRMIIQSCYLVMIADGDKASVELDRLYDIGEALGISKIEVERLITIAEN